MKEGDIRVISKENDLSYPLGMDLIDKDFFKKCKGRAFIVAKNTTENTCLECYFNKIDKPCLVSYGKNYCSFFNTNDYTYTNIHYTEITDEL